MFEQYEEIMSNYNVHVNNFSKGRGAIVVDTNLGIKLLKEVKLHDEKINFLNDLLTKLNKNNFLVDVLIKTREGNLYVNYENKKYILKEWVEGNEISFNAKSDIILAVNNMAKIHNCTYSSIKKQYKKYDKSVKLINTLERHNAELVRIRNNIRKMRSWTEFDILFLKSFKEYYTQGEKALELLKLSYNEVSTIYQDKKVIIHGQYNHHNLIKDNNNKLHTVNFEYASYHFPIIDLYNMLRKILEKNNWDYHLGIAIIEAYMENYKLTNKELKMILYLLTYPEKYWKISNYYFNLNKAWKPKQTLVKLKKLLKQEEYRQDFISNFTNYINN